MIGAAWMVIDRFALPVAPLLSVTWTVKLDVPAVVDVPLMTPVDEAIDSSAGRAPDVMAQLV
jgi:hypothetical protein